MAQAIELCRRCGFECYRGPGSCPSCGDVEVRPSRAARQVAGLALPTRSVHSLPSTPRLRLVDPLPPSRARAARSAFHGASTFVLAALVGLFLGWLAGPAQLGLALPDGTDRIVDQLTQVATWGAMGTTAAGLVAAGVIVARNAARRARQIR